MRRYLFAGTIAAVSVASGAQAVTFGNLYAFGDSLADCCFLGRFTQGDTPTWVDLLPESIGATYVATPETNLAVGGAQSGPTNVVPSTDVSFGFLTGYASQIARFVASPAASIVGPTDIAAIWVGTNDIWAAPFPDRRHPSGRSTPLSTRRHRPRPWPPTSRTPLPRASRICVTSASAASRSCRRMTSETRPSS